MNELPDKWFTFSPFQALLIEGFAADSPVIISERIRIDKVPSWALTDETLQILGEDDRAALRAENFCLCSDYEADALGSPDPNWEGEEPRGIQDTIAEEIAIFPLCLWIEQPTGLRLGPIGHIRRDNGWEILRRRVKYDPMLISQKQSLQSLAMSNLSVAIELHKRILKLDRNGTVWTTTRLLFRALSIREWNIRFLLHAMALESLFGADTEITFRLSTRIAKFLYTDSIEAKALFHKCKELYGWRSKIVHGMRLQKLKPEQSGILMEDIEQMVRKVLKKILIENYIDNFDSKGRETFLDELVFNSPKAV